MTDINILNELKAAEQDADKQLIGNPLLNEVINDLLMIDEESDSRRREKIVLMIERRPDLDEI